MKSIYYFLKEKRGKKTKFVINNGFLNIISIIYKGERDFKTIRALHLDTSKKG